MIHTNFLLTTLVESGRSSAIYCFYILTALVLFYCFLKIVRLDLDERKRDGHKSIHLGKMKIFFISEAENKDYIPQKTFILEIVGYFCFLVTIVLASISWMLEVYLISAISWFWFLAVAIYLGIVRLVAIKTIIPQKMKDY